MVMQIYRQMAGLYRYVLNSFSMVAASLNVGVKLVCMLGPPLNVEGDDCHG